MKSVDQQCVEIIKILELNSGIYDLKIDGIPIWWFVRFRFYEKLFNFLTKRSKKEIYFQDSPSSLKEIIVQNYKQIIIFFIRAVQSGYLIITNQIRRGEIMFFTYPQSRKELRNGKKIDPFIDSIFKKLINQSMIVEQMILDKPTPATPFSHEKKVVFFDWAILIAMFKSIFHLYQRSKISGWNEFEEKSKKINFPMVSSGWIIKAVKEIIISNRNKALIQTKAAQTVIEKFRPKLIIETTSYNLGTMALNYVAKKFSIPIIELQHGIITELHLGYIYFLPKDQINKILPNRILVYGDLFKKAILEASNAFSPEEIRVVGLLRLNNFLEENRLKRETIRRESRKKLGIDYDDFLITITSDSVSGNFFAKFLKETIPLLKRKIRIAIKLHPMDNERKERERYKEIISRFRVKILTDDIIDLYRLLISSDLHVTICSTVFLECLALGVPNIIVDAERRFSSLFPRVANWRGIITVRNPEDFSNKVKEFIINPELKDDYINNGKKLADYFFDTTGNVEENIIKEINKFYIV